MCHISCALSALASLTRMGRLAGAISRVSGVFSRLSNPHGATRRAASVALVSGLRISLTRMGRLAGFFFFAQLFKIRLSNPHGATRLFCLLHFLVVVSNLSNPHGATRRLLGGRHPRRNYPL